MGKRALLIIDLQVGLESGEKKLYQLDQVIEQVNEQIEHYRKNEQPIIFIQHEDEDLVADSPSWQLFSTLKVENNDYFVGKTHANSFYQTVLGSFWNS